MDIALHEVRSRQVNCNHHVRVQICLGYISRQVVYDGAVYQVMAVVFHRGEDSRDRDRSTYRLGHGPFAEYDGSESVEVRRDAAKRNRQLIERDVFIVVGIELLSQ